VGFATLYVSHDRSMIFDLLDADGTRLLDFVKHAPGRGALTLYGYPAIGSINVIVSAEQVWIGVVPPGGRLKRVLSKPWPLGSRESGRTR
jgi:hypothetical protein